VKPKVLLLAYGNPGRCDDGLGPALAAELEELHLPDVTIDVDYQLTVEDAARVAEYDVVIFADAEVQGPGPFSFRPLEPATANTGGVTFSSHSASPAGVLGLAAELFSARPAAYVLGIRGYEFNEFGEDLSAAARENLAHAVRFLTPVLCNHRFLEAAAEYAETPLVAASKGDAG
jgi:hydrogenase maturation protease